MFIGKGGAGVIDKLQLQPLNDYGQQFMGLRAVGVHYHDCVIGSSKILLQNGYGIPCLFSV